MTGRSQWATRSQQDSSTQLHKNILAMFRTQRVDSRPLFKPQIIVRQPTPTPRTHRPSRTHRTFMQVRLPHTHLFCLFDIQEVALDIKNTLLAAISDLKTDIRAIASRLEHVESAIMTHGAAITRSRGPQMYIHSTLWTCTGKWKIWTIGQSAYQRDTRVSGGSPIANRGVGIFNTLLGRLPDAPRQDGKMSQSS